MPGASQALGTPRYTLTIADGRLYARMGSPITNPPQQPGVTVAAGSIVCLDLRAEGKLLWRVAAEEGWAFDGAPVVGGAEALRHHAPRRHSPAGPRRLLRHDDRPHALAAVRLCGGNARPRHARGMHAQLADAGRRHDLREYEPRRGRRRWPSRRAASTG